MIVGKKIWKVSVTWKYLVCYWMILVKYREKNWWNDFDFVGVYILTKS